jgi:hypothetical protein
MGNSVVKDLLELTKPREAFIFDPIGPIKLEAIDFILRNFAEHFVQRLDAIEVHLEKSQGKPFIRAQERPDVGGAALQDVSATFRKLTERLDKLESRAK